MKYIPHCNLLSPIRIFVFLFNIYFNLMCCRWENKEIIPEGCLCVTTLSGVGDSVLPCLSGFAVSDLISTVSVKTL